MSTPRSPLDTWKPSRRDALLALAGTVAGVALAACTGPEAPSGTDDTEQAPTEPYERAKQGAEMVHTEVAALSTLAGDVLERDEWRSVVEPDGRRVLYNRERSIGDDVRERPANPIPTVRMAYMPATHRLALEVYEDAGSAGPGHRVENYFALTAELPPGNTLDAAEALSLGHLRTLPAELFPASGTTTITEFVGGCGQDVTPIEAEASPDPTALRGAEFGIAPQVGVYTIGVAPGGRMIANRYAPEDGEYPLAIDRAREVMHHARTALAG